MNAKQAINNVIEAYVSQVARDNYYDAFLAYSYVKHRGRSPEREPIMAKDPAIAYLYAELIKDRFPAGEAAILTVPKITAKYASLLKKLSFESYMNFCVEFNLPMDWL